MRCTLAIAPALTLLIAACGGGGGSATTARSIGLTLTEFKYSVPTIEAKVGEKATVELKNGGTVEHDFTVDALGLKVSVQPGKSASRSVGPLAAGTYEIYCSVPGHKEAGMKGQLVVK